MTTNEFHKKDYKLQHKLFNDHFQNYLSEAKMNEQEFREKHGEKIFQINNTAWEMLETSADGIKHEDWFRAIDYLINEIIKATCADILVSKEFAEIDLIQVPKRKYFIRDYIKENKFIPNDEIYLHHSDGKIERIKIRDVSKFSR